jgi:hypothetical protein
VRWDKRIRVQRYFRLVERVLKMGPAELRQRLYLAARKRIRGTLVKARRVPADVDVFLQTADRFLASNPSAFLCDRFDARFFFGPSTLEAIRDCICAELPGRMQRVIALADAIGTSGIDILGQHIRIVPEEIDWQADPISGCRHWSARPMDEDEAVAVPGVDVKYVWEVNRQQYLPLLGRSFWWTGNSRYARQAVQMIDSWIGANPVGCGVNWCSHLEVAMRVISWLWTMPFLLSWRDLNPDFVRRWIASIAAHQRHLDRNLSIYTDPTNHLIGEAFALWLSSTMFPEFDGSRESGERAEEILTRELQRQVAGDGVNLEQASSYHRFVLDFSVQFLLLSRRNGRPGAARIAARVERMLEFSAALCGPGGFAPMIGDSDDARGIPLIELVGWDFRDLMSTGAALFSRADWKALAGGLNEATVWLLGIDGAKEYRALPDVPFPVASQSFAEGGYCFLRGSAGSIATEMIVDIGPIGLLPNAAHGHADALSILVRIDGNLLLGDPGTGAYFATNGGRDVLRGTSAHNTVSVDGLDQADAFETFKWLNPTTRVLNELYLGEVFDFVSATHDGYRRLRRAVQHRRSVLFVKRWGWIVVDLLSGAAGPHTIVRHWNFPPTAEVNTLKSGQITAIDSQSGAGLQVFTPEIGDPGGASLRSLRAAPWSSGYGKWQHTTRVEIESQFPAPAVLLTLIVPSVSGDGAPSALIDRCKAQSIGGSSMAWEFECRDGSSSTVVVNPERLKLNRFPSVDGNAEFLYLRRKAHDGPVELAFAMGDPGCVSSKEFDMTFEPHSRIATFTGLAERKKSNMKEKLRARQ